MLHTAECQTFQTTTKKLQLNQNRPQPLLKKSLNLYFDDRLSDHIDSKFGDIKSQSVAFTINGDLTAHRQELVCLDSKLTRARTEWLAEKKTFDERWKVAKDTQKGIFDQIPQFNGYYKDLFIRRERSIKMLGSEIKQSKKKEDEIKQKYKEIQLLREIRDKSETRLENFSIFKTYLNRAKDASRGEYESIKDLIDRYMTLSNARDMLMTMTDKFRDNISRQQKALENDVTLHSNEVLAYRNYLSELLEYDSILREKVFWLADGLERIKTTSAQRTMIIGQIRMAIHNLYRQICKSLHRHPSLNSEDTLGQLMDIRLSIKEISRLSLDVKRMLKAAQLTAKDEAEAKEKLAKIEEEKQKKLEKLANKNNAVRQDDLKVLLNFPERKSKMDEISKLFFPPRTSNNNSSN